MSSMYYQNRVQAAKNLLPPLLKYRYENAIVVALSDSSVEMAETVAATLHCVLTLFLALDVEIPGESVTFGSITEGGTFNLNSGLSQGEVGEYYAEFRGYIEDRKREQTSKVNRLLGNGGLLSPDMLRGRVVILVADALGDGTVLDAFGAYSKPLDLDCLIIATPVAAVLAVDRMHTLGDELHVLNVTNNFMGADHYYVENVHLPHETIVDRLSRVILNWQ